MGRQEPGIADWLKGQDAVFANCSGGAAVLPANAPEGSPVLVEGRPRLPNCCGRVSYAEKFADARCFFWSHCPGFQSALAWDCALPGGTQPGAGCIHRHAKDSAGYGSIATFDDGLMRQAATRLKALLNEPHPGISQQAIQNELDLVRLRTEPMVRLKELSAALAGPETDPNYAQHRTDLTGYLNACLDELKLRADSFEEDPQPAQARNDAFSGSRHWPRQAARKLGTLHCSRPRNKCRQTHRRGSWWSITVPGC